MISPYIGMAVHYTDSQGQCHAAIITNTLNEGRALCGSNECLAARHVSLIALGEGHYDTAPHINIHAEPGPIITMHSASGTLVICEPPRESTWTPDTWHPVHG